MSPILCSSCMHGSSACLNQLLARMLINELSVVEEVELACPPFVLPPETAHKISHFCVFIGCENVSCTVHVPAVGLPSFIPIMCKC